MRDAKSITVEVTCPLCNGRGGYNVLFRQPRASDLEEPLRWHLCETGCDDGRLTVEVEKRFAGWPSWGVVDAPDMLRGGLGNSPEEAAEDLWAR